MNPSRLFAALILMICAWPLLAKPVPFANLARHTQYRDVKISPGGKYLAVAAVVKGQTVLALIHLADHKGHLVRPRDGDDLVDFWWASSDRVVYTVGLHQGGFDPPFATGELYAVDADGGNARMLYGYRNTGMSTGSHIDHGAPEYGTAEFLSAIDNDPHHILVTINDWDSGGSAGSLPAVFKLDVRNGRKERIAIAPAREATFLADHHGHVRFAVANDLQQHMHVYQYAEDGHWTPMPEASRLREYPIAFNEDDSTAYFECGGSPGFGVCRWDPSSGTMKLLWSNPDATPDRLMLGLSRHHWIGVGFTDGRPGLSLFDSHSADAQALIALMKQFPGESVRFVSATRDGSKAVALIQADVDPGLYVLYDRTNHSTSPLFNRAGWINPANMASKQPITLNARDGLKLHGYISYPPGLEGANHLPMVVFVHGGPYGIRDRWDFDPYVQAMATRGYAVLQINYRGSGGYGWNFEHAGWGQWGGAMQDDVTDATRWAIAKGIADPKRMCIFGGSYGGYAALEGAVKEPDLYKCAIGYAGVYDLNMMYTRGDIPQNLYGESYLKQVLGTDPAKLRAASPIDHLDRLKANVMLIVGGKDTRVPPVQGEDLHEALEQRHIAHEWLYKRNEMHGFYDEDNLTELFGALDAFLDRNIGPGAEPTSAAH